MDSGRIDQALPPFPPFPPNIWENTLALWLTGDATAAEARKRMKEVEVLIVTIAEKDSLSPLSRSVRRRASERARLVDSFSRSEMELWLSLSLGVDNGRKE